ncbi:MAG: c-type cytochrome, partial [Sphingomicrobium sp.]
MARLRTAFLRSYLVMLLTWAALATVPAGASTAGDVQTSWRLLDYIAVDYRGAVRGGRVVNSAEYREMTEFSASVAQRLAALPPNPARQALLTDAQSLQSAILSKAGAPQVAVKARKLGSALLAAYPVPMAPASSPNPERGAALYAQNCASCHGANGEGPTAGFAALDPPPIAFADRERARDRSLFGLYQVISQGLEGTAMQSFGSLPEEDRWALAFHAGGLAWRDVAAGKRIWRDDAAVRRMIPD